MKINIKIILCCLAIFAFIAMIGIKLWQAGIIVFDRAEFVALEYVIWNGREYSPISGDYSEGKTIAREKDDFSWKIKMVNEDPSHTFIVARSFLEQSLLVADDYAVPTYGKLTTVSWNENYINDPLFLEAVSKIEEEKTTSFTYQTDGIYVLKENQHMRRLYFAYDGCPVTTNFKGYMGKVYGKWVITTYISQDTRNANGSPKEYPVSCYEIPDKYWDILSEYFD